jgi:hypothetical protein
MSYKSKNGKLVPVKNRNFKISLDQIDSSFDIQVEGKAEQVVMVCGNARGREVVEDLWPDVKWTTDKIFSSIHSADWLFTHIRVTKLPAHLERAVPLAFANVDSLGWAVAMNLQCLAEPRRVCHYIGYDPPKINTYDIDAGDREYTRSLFAEYVPAGTIIGMPESVN